MSAATFQRVLQALDELAAIRGIAAGVEDLKAGRARPAEEFLAELRKKYALPEHGE